MASLGYSHKAAAVILSEGISKEFEEWITIAKCRPAMKRLHESKYIKIASCKRIKRIARRVLEALVVCCVDYPLAQSNSS